MIKKTVLISIKTIHENNRGRLSFFEANRDIPFDIKRIYYISDVDSGEDRGFHAHKKLEQLLICPIGEVTVELDDGYEIKTVILDTPDRGLLLSPNTWHCIKFQNKNTVLLVAASDYYEENDYVRDYNRFREMVKEEFWEQI